MNLQSDPRLPLPNPSTSSLTQRLYEVFRQWSAVINGSLMWSTSGTIAPSTGTWAVGDKCKNDSPSELGTGGSKFVIIGWICLVSGAPGTWAEMRVLTGA